MFKLNLYTNILNTASNLIPYIWFTKFYILDDIQDIVIVRSFLLISVTFLLGGIPTSFNIHQENLTNKNLYKISLIVILAVFLIFSISFLYDFEILKNFNKLSLLALTFLGIYELSIGFFKALLEININLKASFIRLVFVLITISLITIKKIPVINSSQAFLITLIIGYLFPIVYYLTNSIKINPKKNTNLKITKIFKSSIPHYLNIVIQSLVSNIDRFFIILNVLPVFLIDYDFVLLLVGFIFSLTMTPLTQLFHPSYMKKKDNINEGRLIIRKLSNRLFRNQIRLIIPTTLAIYGIVFFGYASSLNPLTLSIILLSIFSQSYIFISCSPFFYQEKDYIHTSITLFSGIVYLSILNLMVRNLGIFGASLSRFIYIILIISLGWLFNKLLNKKVFILSFKQNIFKPLLKISIAIFTLNYFGLKLLYSLI